VLTTAVSFWNHMLAAGNEERDRGINVLIRIDKRIGGWPLIACMMALAVFAAGDTPFVLADDVRAKAVIPVQRYDFGDAFAGQFLDHTFAIRNEGTSPLLLSDDLPVSPMPNKPLATRYSSVQVRPAGTLGRAAIWSPALRRAGIARVPT
jgi:hypothetical protein